METEPQVTELLLRWQELREEGQFVTAAELCAGCPELAAELQCRMESVDHWERFLGTDDEAEAPDPTPASFGKFQVIRSLGRGGQAATLLAFDPDLKRHVVLKLFHSARTPEDQKIVLREGQALARLRSPYVAQCYSAERLDGIVYLVVEYVPGPNLAQRLLSSRLSVFQALELIRQLAEGLAAVHACGLLHRDLKPDNIILADDGRPRLVDFGLAVALGSDALANVSGTFAYMAPEQARGQAERIDARTDLFGLGAVLYELLTGRPPYRAKERLLLWQAAAAGEVVPVGQRNPRLPGQVQELCMRCLAPDPSGRFASAAELAAAVRGLERRRRRLRHVWTAFLLLAAVLGVGYALWPGWHTEPPLPGGPLGDVWPVPAELKRHPEGRALRKDFALKVEPLGGELDPKDGVQVLKVGQLVKFRVESAQDCFVGLWDVTESAVIQLIPNDAEPDQQLRAGQPRQLPAEKVIRAKKPSGVEYLHVVASTHPLRLLAGQFRGGFEVFAEPREKARMLAALRDMEVVDPGEAMTEVILRFEVRP
jgi:serine/threonine-protein kinase